MNRKPVLWNKKKPKRGGLSEQIVGGLNAYKRRFKVQPKFVFCRCDYFKNDVKEKEFRIRGYKGTITLVRDDRIPKSHFVIVRDKKEWLTPFDASKMHGNWKKL